MTPEQQQYVLDYRPAAEAFVRRKYKPRTSQQLDDFISAAYMGLVEAATRYDPKAYPDVTFWGYARFWVFKMCNEQISGERTIRRPRSVQRGDEEDRVKNVPLETADEEQTDPLSAHGLGEGGFDSVEADMMYSWVEYVMSQYGEETRHAWRAYLDTARLPGTEDLRAYVLMLDDEVREGFE